MGESIISRTSPKIEQTTGTSISTVMSQNAVTDELNLKVDTADLATVATSGSYDDLVDEPELPISIANGGTGATNSSDARYNLSIPAATGLISTTDFDNILDTGFHITSSSTNSPNGSAGPWAVINVFPNSTTFGAQMAILATSSPKFYLRTRTDGSVWQSWKQVTLT